MNYYIIVEFPIDTNACLSAVQGIHINGIWIQWFWNIYFCEVQSNSNKFLLLLYAYTKFIYGGSRPYQVETFSVSKTLTLSQEHPFVCQKLMLLPTNREMLTQVYFRNIHAHNMFSAIIYQLIDHMLSYLKCKMCATDIIEFNFLIYIIGNIYLISDINVIMQTIYTNVRKNCVNFIQWSQQ